MGLVRGEAEGDIVNCPSRLDKTGKEGLSGITCPVTCQPRVAPRHEERTPGPMSRLRPGTFARPK